MKKLVLLYKPLSIIEIFLLLNILLHIVFFVVKRLDQNWDLLIAFLTFSIHFLISWKIVSNTSKGLKANETLVVIGHILNFIKIILILLLVAAGIFFYNLTHQYMNIKNEIGLWYYSFYVSFIIFLIIVPLNFIAYFGIVIDNKKNVNMVVDSIGFSKD